MGDMGLVIILPHNVQYNFNHERWFIVVYILSVCRAVIEECFKWAMQRKTFGKKLMVCVWVCGCVCGWGWVCGGVCVGGCGWGCGCGWVCLFVSPTTGPHPLTHSLTHSPSRPPTQVRS
jgi:hypothetical protein